MPSFLKIKPSRNGEITLLFIDKGKTCPGRKFLASLIFLFTHNKIFAKTSGFTVTHIYLVPRVPNFHSRLLQSVRLDSKP